METSNNIMFEALSIEKLKELIKESVSDSYAEITKNVFNKVHREELMTREETAKFLKINLSTLYYWTKSGKLLAYGIANRRYYKRTEVLSRLEKLYNGKKFKY